MSPFGPLDNKDEQSEAERLAIARRYRVRRGDQLRDLAAGAIGHRPRAAGEFSTVPIESLAAIPLLGAFFAFAVRARQSRKALTPNVLLAIDEERLHLLAVRPRVSGRSSEPLRSWPLAAVRVSSVRRRFMRDEVTVEIDGEAPLRLFAPSLRTSPWSAEIVRSLHGEAPEPLDLSGPS
jgi:hypothetical protein